MPRLQGLIFDLDGTLLDSAADLRQAMNIMLEQMNLRPLTLAEVKSMMGDGSMEMVRRALIATGHDVGKDLFPYVQQFIGYYRNIIKPDPSQIYPYAREILEKFSNNGVKLGICTNKQEATSYKILEQLDLKKYFEFIAGGDTFQYHKPNPEHVYGVITALDVPRDSCVFIGDGRNDVFAAHGANIQCIVVTHVNEGDFHELGADKVISGFEQLPSALKSLGWEMD